MRRALRIALLLAAPLAAACAAPGRAPARSPAAAAAREALKVVAAPPEGECRALGRFTGREEVSGIAPDQRPMDELRRSAERKALDAAADAGATHAVLDEVTPAPSSRGVREAIVGATAFRCGPGAASAPEDEARLRAAPPAAAGCGKDTDCKGDRICVSGACTDPPPRAPAPPGR